MIPALLAHTLMIVTGGIGLQDIRDGIGYVSAGSLATVAVAVAIRKVVAAARSALTFLRKWGRIADEWLGAPGHPGVIDRLRAVEAASLSAARSAEAAQATAEVAVAGVADVRMEQAVMAEQNGIVVAAVSRLLPNGGGSLSDQLGRIEDDTARQAGRYIADPRGADTHRRQYAAYTRAHEAPDSDGAAPATVPLQMAHQPSSAAPPLEDADQAAAAPTTDPGGQP